MSEGDTNPVLLLIEQCIQKQQEHEALNRTYPLQLEIPNWRDNNDSSENHD